jgi:ketosteroid isomerase-like protein
MTMVGNMTTAIVLATLSAAAAAADTPKAAAPNAGMSRAECEVWNRELGFSRTVQRHDAAAFAGYVHEGAVFAAGTAAPQRGRAAVIERWTEIIEGKKFALHWHPAYVSIGGDPGIALSSGPAWIEDFDPNAKQRHAISHYTSTWVKDHDGQWRVLFDGSAAPWKPATEEEIAKLVAKQSQSCPQLP